jgi:hypothetical protein
MHSGGKPKMVTANYFVLSGSGVEVIYNSTVMAPDFPNLQYKDGAFVKNFGPNQIQYDHTGLGELVSVSLILSVDAGGQRFGFFLPLVEITGEQPVDFRTVGIYETFSGPFSGPPRPSTWRCIEMTGTAQLVAVPI